VAVAVVNDVLNLKEYDTKPDGTVVHFAPVTPTAEPTAASTGTPAAPSATPRTPTAGKLASALLSAKTATAAAATTAAAPAKTSKELLAEMVFVLGKEDRTSNYLARDLTSSAFPGGPDSLRAADSYLQGQYGPGKWDPRLQYDARRRGASHGEPIVIRAPTDQQLRQQYGQEHPSIAAPSAPPAIFEHGAVPMPKPLHTRSAVPSHQHLYPPMDSAAAHQRGAATADPRRLMETSSPYALRRPVEGTALQYLRANQVGVINTDAGRKYVPPMEHPAAYYSPDRSIAVSEGYSAAPRPQSGSQRLKSVLAGGAQVPSPTSVGAVHDREVYLHQVRQRRQQLMATTAA
jgi:hypothetical protein